MSNIYEKFEQSVLAVGVAQVAFPTCIKYGVVKQPEAIFIRTVTGPTINGTETYAKVRWHPRTTSPDKLRDNGISLR